MRSSLIEGRRYLGLVALMALAGCGTVADINPFQRAAEPLPPVQGNVIATSSSRDLPGPLDTTDPIFTDPAADPGTAAPQ